MTPKVWNPPVSIQVSGSKAIGSVTGPVFPLSGSQVGSPS
jgi:hypothetical protein